jgi:hypothetical protein
MSTVSFRKSEALSCRGSAEIHGVVVVVVVDEPGIAGTTTVVGAGCTTTAGGCVDRSSVQEKQPLAMTQAPRPTNNIA